MSIVYVVQAMNLDESMSLEGIFSSEKLAEEYCIVADRKSNYAKRHAYSAMRVIEDREEVRLCHEKIG